MADMSDEEREKTIAEEAAGWVARLSSRDATDEDRRRFAHWKAKDLAHAAAFKEMSILWRDLAQVPKSVAPHRGRRVAGAGVAGLLFLGCLGYMADETGVIDRYRSDFHTPVGMIGRFALDDGSIVTLNTDSAIQVKYDQARRQIILLRGEAFFDVAPNPARPFVVSGERTEAIALGTHYAVKVGRHDEVMVEEGHVAVTFGSQRAVLEAGGMAELDDHGRLRTRTGDVAGLTSWRSGKLVFSGQPLGEVLAELDRYHRGRIVVLDDRASGLRVSGVFGAGNIDQVLRVLEQSLPIRITRLAGWVTLVRSR
ncbi:FecR family protein [Neorhizobium sp. Rsf11]|uniref:FecR family protein n=2 Tax=Neorhizobium TaxID=1525371 RepID=A0ABV0M3A1_9HYPH|nr:FecR family protein [Neorhizobium petrolearium]MCC2609348.1 FecR family protein [Neorhizobium petrolearium]WGI69565.1 FecR family protein [Neorhizobium petrolearium]